MDTQKLPAIGVAHSIWIPGDHSIALVVAPLFGLILLLTARRAQRTSRDLPPGPKGLPIVGDIIHIGDKEWLASPQRRDEYGDILHSQSPRNPLMFLQAS